MPGSKLSFSVFVECETRVVPRLCVRQRECVQNEWSEPQRNWGDNSLVYTEVKLHPFGPWQPKWRVYSHANIEWSFKSAEHESRNKWQRPTNWRRNRNKYLNEHIMNPSWPRVNQSVLYKTEHGATKKKIPLMARSSISIWDDGVKTLRSELHSWATSCLVFRNTGLRQRPAILETPFSFTPNTMNSHDIRLILSLS